MCRAIPRSARLTIATLMLAACAPPPPRRPAPPPAAPAAIYEEEIKAVEKPHIVITDLNEAPSPDRKTVTLSGTLINRGTRATREVYVHVEALNKDGAVVVSADSDPSSETIGPGSTGRFAVTFENRPDVERYHVEAVSR